MFIVDRRAMRICLLSPLALMSTLALAQPSGSPPVPPTEQHPSATPPPPTDNPAPPSVGDQAPAPKVLIDETAIDFGKVLNTGRVERKVTVANTGSGAAQVLGLSPSCSCVSAAIDTREIAPGGEAVITVTFDPTKLKAGPNQQRILVTTTDPDPAGARVTINVSATVVTPVEVSPEVPTFGEVMKGTTKTLKLTVTGREPGFGVTEVKERVLPGMTGKVTPGVVTSKIGTVRDATVDGEKRRVVDIELTLAGDKGIGNAGRELLISTNDDRQPLVTLTMYGEIVGDLKLTPARVSAGALNRGQEFSREIKVTSRTGKPFQITGIEFPANQPDDLSLRFTTDLNKTATEHVIRVSGKAGQNPGRFAPVFLIKTDVKDEDTVRSGVSAVVR